MDAHLTATETIQCLCKDALKFQIELLRHKLQLNNERGYGHPFEVEYTEEEGLFIYAESFTEEDFDSHICQILSELITAANLELIDFSYCVIGDDFYPMSHYGGTIEVYRNGTMKML
jgi:hypothetical protein